jgi:hypothetical protein
MKKVIFVVLCIVACIISGCISVPPLVPPDKSILVGIFYGTRNDGMLLSLTLTNNTYELSKPFYNSEGSFVIKGDTIELSDDGTFTFKFSNNNTILTLQNTKYTEIWTLERR